MSPRQDVLMVDKDLYDTMVAAYARVKDERFKNKQLADSLTKQIMSLEHEIDSFTGKAEDALANVEDLQETVHSLSEEHTELKIKLGEKVETVSYGMTEIEDKLHKLSKDIKQLQASLKPMQDAYKH